VKRRYDPGPAPVLKAPLTSDPTKAFHAHLDVCVQCREHPFNLCPIGDRLIRAAAGVTT
jgi:hypothetical protein